MSKYKVAQRSFWLITTRAHSWKEVLTIEASGKTALPVFSFQEGGEFFLGLEATGAHWWTREATTGELVSLLLGLCSRVDEVALDPSPGLGKREIVDQLSTSRRHFVCRLMGEVALHSEHKNPSGPEPGRFDPTRV